MVLFVSNNCNGLRNVNKFKKYVSVINESRIDFLLLQETFWDESFVTNLSGMFEGKVFYSNSTQLRQGVAIFVSQKYKNNVAKVYNDKDGRFLHVKFEHEGSIYNIMNVYAHNVVKEKSDFFMFLDNYMQQYDNIIISGDWNTTFSKLDRASKTEHKDDIGYKTLCNLINNNNVYDIWRRRNPDCRTFSRKRVCNLDLQQSRIDYFLICRNVSQYVQYVRYKDTSFSDHAFVEMKVIFDNVERGPGVWILNNTLLDNEEYVSKVIKIIEESKNCPLFETETLIWWDNLKYQIKKFSQIFSKRIAKKKNAEYYTLQNKIERICNRIAEGDKVNIEQYENLKLELSVLEEEKCKGAILRSKAYWATENDKCTKYFFNLEKHKQEVNCIKELYDSEHNIVVSDTEKLLELQYQFYNKLYSCVETNEHAMDELLQSVPIKVNTDDQELCDSDISISRDIADTIASIRDIIDIIEDENMEAYIVKFDQEKAFDKLCHKYLIKVLGVFVGKNQNECIDRNWKDKIRKITNIVNMWKQRHLTLSGRAVVISSLMMSRVWYTLAISSVPQWVSDKLKQLCINFLWSSGSHLLQYRTIIGSKDKGGLNIPDVYLKMLSFRLKFLGRFLNPDCKSLWKSTFNYFLKRVHNMNLDRSVLYMSLDTKSLLCLPPVYKEMLEAWQYIKAEISVDLSTIDIYHQPLFFNSEKFLSSKINEWDCFITAGIVQLKDVTYEVIPGFLPIQAIFEIIQEKVDNVSFDSIKVKYEKLLMLIPDEWKTVVCTKCYEVHEEVSRFFIEYENKVSDVSSCKTKRFYSVLLTKCFIKPNSYEFWRDHSDINESEFADIWKQVHSYWKPSDCIDLDFKICHNRIFTNIKLKKIKILDSDLCQNCKDKNDKEDLFHIFLTCEKLKEFHDYIFNILFELFVKSEIDLFQKYTYKRIFLLGITGKVKVMVMANFNVISLNCNGLCDINKRNCIFSLCNDRYYDIICLQETFWNDLMVERIKKDKIIWNGDIFYSNSGNNRQGVAILVSKKLKNMFSEVANENGRYIHINGKINDEIIDIYNIYAPNNVNERCDFFLKCKDKISNGKYVLVAGDFKTTLSSLDKSGKTLHCNDKAVKTLYNIMQEKGLCDIWRNRNVDIKTFSKKTSCTRNKIQELSVKSANGIQINNEQFLELKTQLEDIETYKCKGAILRSKSQWALESDRNTAYFLKLEKYRQNKNLISEIKDCDGKIVTETNDLLDVIHDYYKHLFSCVSIDMHSVDEILNNVNVKIDDEDVEMCDDEINIEEIEKSLKGKDISDTVASVRDIMDLVEMDDIECYLLKLDQEKAFDRAGHEYLFSVLDKFGFAEPLSIAIKKNCEIRGVVIPNTNVEEKVFVHADDTTLTLVDKNSVSETFRVLELYEKASGAKLNKEKSEVLALGKGKICSNDLKIWKIKECDEVLQLLGIWVGKNKTLCENLNWESKVQSITKF
ncbi:unnamed protein product [Mytilus coruscus]|uniref:exodeoxyribonuclease III n=1 Tax=Mytilus coruscus TaxID=42192 RepID=A0A6J8DD02_MYTCO|nr:unnamed protein product [Mytilus coruscus]